MKMSDKAFLVSQLDKFLAEMSPEEILAALEREYRERRLPNMQSALDNMLGMTTDQSSDALDRLGECANGLSLLEEEIESMESELHALKSRKHEIRSEIMVDLMMEAQVTSVSHGGRVYALAPYVSGTWPKDPEKARGATEWLEGVGADGIIKSHISATFPRGDLHKARVVKDSLPPESHPKLETKVHPSTYKAFVRERLRNGEDLDTDALGVTIGNIVSIKKG